MITIPFKELIDTDSPIWQIINRQRFPSLYPADTLPEEIIENINSYFYDRQIAYSSPERFLMQWYRLVRERAYAWTKLLVTEKVLRDEDMLYNYDLNESSEDTRTTTTSNESTSTPDIKTKSTPDLLTTQNQFNNQTQQTNQSGYETGTHEQRTNEMDTPDGMTNDIDNYLTRAQKDSQNDRMVSQNSSNVNNYADDKTITRQTGTTTQYRYGNEKTEFDGQTDDRNLHTLRRYGNIGTMTVAQVLGGYRDAQRFDVYSSVIFPECEQLFLHFVELESVDLW